MTLRELTSLREDAFGLALAEAEVEWASAAGLPLPGTVAARVRAHPRATSADGLAEANEALAEAGADPARAGRAARLASLRDFLVRARARALDPGAADELAQLPRRPSVRPPGDAGLHGALPEVAVERELPRLRERQRRAEMEHALAEAAEAGADARASAWEAAQAALGELRLGDPGEAAARLQLRGWGAGDAPGQATSTVRAVCERALEGTAALASDLVAWLLERHSFARPSPGGAERHDVLFLLESPGCAAAFPRGELLRTCRRWAEMLRLDLGCAGALRLDDDERPLKQPGARAVALDPPGEVRLSLFPQEGPRALAGLLSAFGAAQLRCGPPEDAPPEDLWLGDAALGHAAGEVFGGLVRDPAFLRRCAKADLRRDDERAIAAAAVLDLRLAAAAALSSLDAHREGSLPAAAEGFRERFAQAALAELPRGLASAGLDPFLGSFSRLRGLCLAARLRHGLRERFDEDYWRNPRALPALRGLWARGGRPTLGELWAEGAPPGEAAPSPPSVEPLLAELAQACR